MNKHLPDIRTSIDNCFADMDVRPSLQYKVLARVRGEVKVKKKLSVGLVLTIVLALLAVGAAAAVLLSMQQLVEKEAIPMANEYAGDMYTAEDTNALLQLAQANGIKLSDETTTQIEYALSQGAGYFKEEMLMAMAKAEFGDYPDAWTLEQQKWFDDVCVAIGFISQEEKSIPEGGETAKTPIVQAANEYIRRAYDPSAPLDDPAQYRIGVQYLNGDADGEYSGMYWSVSYAPLSLEGAEYWVYLRDDGDVLGDVVRPGLQSNSTVVNIRTAYNRMFGSQETWNQTTLQSFRQAVMNASDTTSKPYLCLARTTYPNIPDNAVSQEKARALAAESVGLDTAAVQGHIFLIGSQPNPVWKVRLVQGSTQWSVELDCITGEIRSTRLLDNADTKWWMEMVLWEVSDDVEKHWTDNSPSVG
ncbi:MAG: PepSY domain-containing protein [Eubacteriales bacterium]|nr:PepSY domain-containing protein [Eubacteriales bacterium]MDD4513445.1 PepSY domain-containing protein [Eubacteriales bacterium]